MSRNFTDKNGCRWIYHHGMWWAGCMMVPVEAEETGTGPSGEDDPEPGGGTGMSNPAPQGKYRRP